MARENSNFLSKGLLIRTQIKIKKVENTLLKLLRVRPWVKPTQSSPEPPSSYTPALPPLATPLLTLWLRPCSPAS